MSRLYDALTALERKRPRQPEGRALPPPQASRTRRSWPAITVMVVALCGATGVITLRSRSTAPPAAPAANNTAGMRTAAERDIRERAREAAALGLIDEAEALLGQAIKLAPADPIAWNDLGVVLVGRAQLPAAIEALKLSVALDPKSAATHRNLAVALEKYGEAAEAVSHYRAFVALSPDNADRQRIARRLARSR